MKYIKMQKASGVQDVNLVIANRLIPEKIMQSKAQRLDGNAKNAFQKKRGFQVICMLVPWLGFTIDLRKQQLIEEYHG